MTKPSADPRDRYPHFDAVQTRWMDNDLYGHLNNVVYYSYIDTVVNAYLVRAGGLDIAGGPVIGIVVESGCLYRDSAAFPEQLDAGLRVGHLGKSSVRYEVAFFRPGTEAALAGGYFVHVFVDRATRRPVPIPDPIRGALERLLVAD